MKASRDPPFVYETEEAAPAYENTRPAYELAPCPPRPTTRAADAPYTCPSAYQRLYAELSFDILDGTESQ